MTLFQICYLIVTNVSAGARWWPSESWASCSCSWGGSDGHLPAAPALPRVQVPVLTCTRALAVKALTQRAGFALKSSQLNQAAAAAPSHPFRRSHIAPGTVGGLAAPTELLPPPAEAFEHDCWFSI